MTIFLLLISLLLNGIAIYAIFILYARQNRLIEAEKKQAGVIREMEDLLSAYLLEMKEENDRFINSVTNQTSTSVYQSAGKELEQELKKFDPENGLLQVEKVISSDEGSSNQSINLQDTIPNATRLHAASAYKNKTVPTQDLVSLHPSNEEIELKQIPADSIYSDMVTENQESEMEKTSGMLEADSIELSGEGLIDHLVSLRKEGKSAEEIAKMLNKGKTEIELLLKFSQSRQ